MSVAEFNCNVSEPSGTLSRFWEHTVGSCHAPLALRADWQEQMRLCHTELGFLHVRFHGLLSDDMGTMIVHRDEFLYSFFNADRISTFCCPSGCGRLSSSASCRARSRREARRFSIMRRTSRPPPGAPRIASAVVERIDDTHANAKKAWTEMGAPEYPSAAQVSELREASRIGREPQELVTVEGTVHFDVELPAHGVAAVTLYFAEPGAAK